jgi:hypothetical protein
VKKYDFKVHEFLLLLQKRECKFMVRGTVDAGNAGARERYTCLFLAHNFRAEGTKEWNDNDQKKGKKGHEKKRPWLRRDEARGETASGNLRERHWLVVIHVSSRTIFSAWLVSSSKNNCALSIDILTTGILIGVVKISHSSKDPPSSRWH